MKNNESNEMNSDKSKRAFVRKQEDLDLKKNLLSGPELFITERGTDEHLERLSLKIKLRNGTEFNLEDYVSTLVTIFESKFHQEWFYRLADVYGDDRSVMEQWVKPDYARQTIVEFVYGRFPYSVIRMLRKNKLKYGTVDNRLYHLLTPKASDDLDIVINDVFELMGEDGGKKYKNNPSAFKEAYSNKYKVYYQSEINF